MIFNTHTHINDEEKEKVLQLLSNCKSFDVTKMLAIGYDFQSSKKAIDLSNYNSGSIYAAVGIHPSNIEEDYASQLKDIEALVKENNITAIGEIGLDYYWNKSKIVEQKAVFEQQLQMAVKYNKPVVIHCRDAYMDTYEMISKYSKHLVGCILHCYSGSVEMMERFVKLGCYIGIGGVVTFKNAKEVKNVVSKISQDRLLVETDDPYLTPVPFRGQKNEPSYVKYVVEEIAKIRNETFEKVVEYTFNNAMKALNL